MLPMALRTPHLFLNQELRNCVQQSRDGDAATVH